MSTLAPSVRTAMRAASAESSSMPAAAIRSIAPLSSQPVSRAFSPNTSHVPCLVPGMNATISAPGRSSSTSLQLAFGFVIIAPSSPGTTAANA